MLLVEDDAHIADLINLYLRREGHHPYLVADGEWAADLFAARSPDWCS